MHLTVLINDLSFPRWTLPSRVCPAPTRIPPPDTCISKRSNLRGPFLSLLICVILLAASHDRTLASHILWSLLGTGAPGPTSSAPCGLCKPGPGLPTVSAPLSPQCLGPQALHNINASPFGFGPAKFFRNSSNLPRPRWLARSHACGRRSSHAATNAMQPPCGHRPCIPQALHDHDNIETH